MSTLSAEAAAAREALRAAEAAAREDWRRQQSQAALAELKRVLTRPDGTSLVLGDLGLSRVVSDMELGLAVWSDGAVSLACHRRDDQWECRLVRQVDGAWTGISGRLTSLAELGVALEAV